MFGHILHKNPSFPKGEKMLRKLICLLAVFFAFGLLTAPAAAEEPPENTTIIKPGIAPGEDGNKDNQLYIYVKTGAELTVESILSQIARMTGLEVVADKDVLRITIKFISNIRADYDVIDAILEINDVKLEKRVIAGKQMIHAHAARNLQTLQVRMTPFLPQDAVLPKESVLVTQIIYIKYAAPDDIERTLTNKIINRAGAGMIMTVRGHPILIVRGFAPEVDYYAQVIKALDLKPREMNLYVLDIIYAYADDLASRISTVMQRRGRTGQPRPDGSLQQDPQLIADARTNKLLILAMEDDFEEIKNVVKELDVPVENPAGSIHVYRLKNTDATKLATALQSILTGQRIQAQRAGQPAPPGQTQVESRVVADEQTNSLIIEADQRSYDEIVEIIKKLDIRRPQVFIEAAIVEVSATSSLNLGFELASISAAGQNWRTAGSSAWGLTTPKDNKFESLEKVPASMTGGIAFLFKEKFGRIPLYMQVLQKDSDFNVISTPRILTNDNEKGEIKVSEQKAVASTTYSNTGQSSTGFGGYQEASLTLTITPHISADDYLRLEITFLKEDFAAEASPDPTIPPAKKSRSLTATLTIPDKEIVVIGGLTSRNTNTVINKIPLLGDIPILGYLFRYSTDLEDKRNLYIFICPRIMREERFEDLITETARHREAARQDGVQMDYMERLMDKRWEQYLSFRMSEKFLTEIVPELQNLSTGLSKELQIKETLPPIDIDDLIPKKRDGGPDSMKTPAPTPENGEEYDESDIETGAAPKDAKAEPAAPKTGGAEKKDEKEKVVVPPNQRPPEEYEEEEAP
jgi:general secretion pathway protein D